MSRNADSRKPAMMPENTIGRKMMPLVNRAFNPFSNVFRLPY